MKSVGELSQVCSQIVLKCLYLARIGRPDILWSVNKFARSITKWTKTNDKRLNRLISDIHHTCEYKHYWYVDHTAKQCRLGLFQDSDFAGDVEYLKSTSGRTVCVWGNHTFVPISWMCKKQTAVSHSSTESEIISLDTGLRLDGLPALELWDLIDSVLGNFSRVSDRSGQPEYDVHKSHNSQKKIDVMEDIDFVPSYVQSARQQALLYVFEDNEAVIKGRSPTMRHVSRTHNVALDWLFDKINLDPKNPPFLPGRRRTYRPRLQYARRREVMEIKRATWYRHRPMKASDHYEQEQFMESFSSASYSKVGWRPWLVFSRVEKLILRCANDRWDLIKLLGAW